MNIQKTLLTTSFFVFCFFNSVLPMLVTVPSQQSMQAQQEFQLSIAPHHNHIHPQPMILRLRDTHMPAPQSPETTLQPVQSTVSSPANSSYPWHVTALTNLNKEVVAQFNKAAPYLAVCAFAVQYAQIFNSRQPAPVSPQAIANLTPGQQRLHTLLQENDQLKQRLKSISWHALFSLALLHPKFNNSYESLETANDVRNALNLLNPALRYSALQHLTNRYMSKVKSFAIAQMSKLLMSVYRHMSPNTAHPSAAKTTIDLVAMASIYAVISPQIVGYCSQPNGVVATFAREKTLHAYNYLPETVKQKLLAFKNWCDQISAQT
jgi:hypothetical protein